MKIMPDFGNVRDNEAAFCIAASYINAGDYEYGGNILMEVRDFILETGEIKSLHGILPAVLDVLKRLEARKSAGNNTAHDDHDGPPVRR